MKNLPILVACLLLITGCAGGEPVRYYLVAPTTQYSAAAQSTVSIEIIDLEIPQYMERLQIASRRPDSQLVFSSSHQWAESLRKNLTRSLARNLTNMTGSAAIGTPASRLGETPDYRLSIYIEQFERSPDQYVHLVTRWQLRDVESRKTVANESNEYISDRRIAAKDYAGTVSAMSELLGQFSETLAQRIKETQ